MRFRHDRNRLIAGAGAVAAALLLVACGDSSSSTSTGSNSSPSGTATSAGTPTISDSSTTPSDAETTPHRTKPKGCQPNRVKARLPSAHTVQEGEPAGLKLRHAKATLTVTGTESPQQIVPRSGGTSPIKPDRSAFVAVSYHLKNRGPGAVKPSYDINRIAVVEGANGKVWLAAGNECGGPIAASWAKEKNLASPTAEVTSGKTVTTAVVFVVSRAARGDLTLRIPGQETGVRLSKPE